jgi:hypothetical protein
MIGHRSGLVPRLKLVVTTLVDVADIHSITVDKYTFTCFTAVGDTGCHYFQDNLSSLYFVNTKVLQYVLPLQFLFQYVVKCDASLEGMVRVQLTHVGEICFGLVFVQEKEKFHKLSLFLS